MRSTRRYFLKSSALAMVGLGFAPRFLRRAIASTSAPSRKVLVILFQRGAADGLSMVPPVSDPQYYALRPSLALRRPGAGSDAALRLDGNFGLHPALAPLKRFWDDGSLAIVQGVGSPKPTRSHFDAQDFIEAGTPGARAADGWINRALTAQPEPEMGGFRAVALQPNLPRSLNGPAAAIAMSSLADFRLRAGRLSASAEKGFESMYGSAVDLALRHSGGEAFDALRRLQSAKLEEMPPQNGAKYPNAPLGKRMADIARLIRADLGLEVAATDCGGWDTHVNQGNDQGQLAGRLKELAESIAAFAIDLGDRLGDVCLLTMTEFGRTVRENGSRGTDHGNASVMMVLGGGVRGGRVFGRWPGLEESNLFEGRDLAVTVDFRTVLSELLARQLKISQLQKVFPGLDANSARPLGIIS